MIRWTHPGGARRAALATALVAATLAVPVTAQLRDQADLDAIYRIKQEGGSNSKVMETLSYLTDVHGPRLTNSPMMHQAAEWAQKQLTSWGLANVHTEKWGPFGRGWVNEHTSIRMDAPQPFVMLGYPEGVDARHDRRSERRRRRRDHRERRRLCQVQGDAEGQVRPAVAEPRRRRVLRVADAPLHRRRASTTCRTSRSAAARGRFPGGAASAPGMAFRKKRMAFYKDEGVLAVVEMSAGARGDNGAVIAQGPMPGDGDRTVDGQVPVPQVVLAGEHYGRLLRVLDKKVPVQLTMNVRSRFVDTLARRLQRDRRDSAAPTRPTRS